MRERAATADSAEFDNEGGIRALLRRALGRNPLDAVALFVLVIAAGAILINALYRQPGPHPAPIFSVKPRPVATEPAERRPAACRGCVPRRTVARSRADIITDIQRELSRRGLYDGRSTAAGPRPTRRSAISRPRKLKATGEPSEDVLRAISARR